ncbi:uncharacterized protein Art8 isoform X2 [Plodia interpunctella]|uniref:uncharacterized protein Art8 isoform X2 n=1 Tax=Plodia interpunctella TaxID=58824 RepID=UPI0023682DAF|nr:uncharacterized protein LOC128677481 isoform X2 [Plodia interpunctella]
MESTIQNDYFTSYEDLEVHKLMIEDSPRTEAYKEAISENKDFFKDKVVMDVGCGTGILSIFCAQAGAKKVYAVEASNLANLAKEIIKENKFEDIIEWDDVHGVSMATFAKQLRTSKGNKPEIMTLDEEDILADTVTLCTINLKEDKLESLDKFSSQHVTAAKREGLYQGLCIWFDCVFPNTTGEGAPVKLDTSPNSPPTHWKQAVIVLPEEQEIEEDEPIAFKMEISRDQIHDRRYIIEVDLLDPETTEHPVPCCCRTLKCILIKTYMDGSFFKALMQDDNIEEEPDEND